MDARTVLAAFSQSQRIDFGNLPPTLGEIGGLSHRSRFGIRRPQRVALRRQRARLPDIDVDLGDAGVSTEIHEHTRIPFRVEPRAVGRIVAACGKLSIIQSWQIETTCARTAWLQTRAG